MGVSATFAIADVFEGEGAELVVAVQVLQLVLQLKLMHEGQRKADIDLLMLLSSFCSTSRMVILRLYFVRCWCAGCLLLKYIGDGDTKIIMSKGMRSRHFL